MWFRSKVAAFVQAPAQVGDRSVTNMVERRLLREEARFGENQGQLTVLAAAGLLRHELVRDADEGDSEYAARSELFGTLLGHVRRG